MGTKDVDFAVYIPEKEKFLDLKKYLEEKEGFRNSSQNQYVMFNSIGQQVDLLPFGEIEVEGKVMIDGTGLTQIAVNGFREVYEVALVPVEYEGGHTFKVCSLPGIVILKLVAYDDRPEIRQKDIRDISKIIQNYFDIETDLIYDRHLDLFDSKAELPLIAARVLGRQMQTILNRSSELKKRIVSIIEPAIADKENHKIVSLLLSEQDTTAAFIASLLSEIIKGINDKLIDQTTDK